MQASRPYAMVARAETAAATGQRILDAAVEVFWELPTDQISLDEVGRRAGVTVQTVIRRFGGREGLLAAAVQRESEKIRSQRLQAPIGDAAGAVHVLMDHYEALGDRVLKMLAEEDRIPRLCNIADRGRAVRAEWCGRVFAPFLRGVPPADRARRLAQFVTVCDVYTWKLLRCHTGLSRRQTEQALVELLHPLTEGVCHGSSRTRRRAEATAIQSFGS